MKLLVKTGRILNFKEFNDDWAMAGNFAYSIQFRNKKRALEIESYLVGLGFFKKTNGEFSPNWNNKLRKNFTLKVYPKQKGFLRTSKVISQTNRYKRIYKGECFNNFCFKFVIIEKTNV